MRGVKLLRSGFMQSPRLLIRLGHVWLTLDAGVASIPSLGDGLVPRASLLSTRA